MAARIVSASVAIAAVLVCAFASAGVLLARDYYVDPVNGDDANDGLSWETALKTITAAGQKAWEANDGVNIFLSEGTFCAESGEAFPIEIGNLLLLSGASSVSTVIDAGDSAGILSIEGYPDENDYVFVTLDNVTIQHDRLDSAANEAPAVDATDRASRMTLNDVCLRRLSTLSWADDQGIFRGVFSMECYGSTFEDVTGPLASYQPIPPHHFLLDDCSFHFSDEILSDLWGVGRELSLSTSSVGVVSIRLTSCQFNALGEIFAVDLGCDRINIENCLFVNCRVKTRGAYWYESCHFYFCTFIGCEMAMGAYRAHIHYSVLDDGCVNCGFGQVYKYCRVPPEYPYGADNVSCSSGPPMFVHGPLGPYYLSNESSGQERTSPCAGLARYVQELRWPPEGSTTRTDGVPDEAPFDIGYHYPSVPPPPPAVSIRTDRTEYVTGEEMRVYPSYENRGVKVEGAIYFAFGPESLDWLIFWPWMTFVPTPWAEGTLYSGVSYTNLPPTTHTIPESLAAGGYLWLGAVLNSDGTFASDIALWPITISAD